MAITLNLNHSFDTRVVVTGDTIVALRKMMADGKANAKKALQSDSLKERADAKRAIEEADRYSSMPDEDMLIAMFTQAMKNGVKESIFSELKDLGVTRMSPVKTTARPREAKTECPRCIHDKTCIKVAQAGCKAVTE